MNNNQNVLTDENFEELVVEHSQKTPVVILFSSERCPPCQRLKKDLPKWCAKYNVMFYIVDLSKNMIQFAQDKRIMSVPTTFLFKNGTEVLRVEGYKLDIFKQFEDCIEDNRMDRLADAIIETVEKIENVIENDNKEKKTFFQKIKTLFGGCRQCLNQK